MEPLSKFTPGTTTRRDTASAWRNSATLWQLQTLLALNPVSSTNRARVKNLCILFGGDQIIICPSMKDDEISETKDSAPPVFFSGQRYWKEIKAKR